MSNDVSLDINQKTQLYQGMIGLEYGLPVVPLHFAIEYRHIQAVDDFDEIKAFDSITQPLKKRLRTSNPPATFGKPMAK